MANKMTKVEMFNAIKAVEGLTQDMVEFIDHEIELLQKKSANKKATKTQEENVEIKAVIKSVLTSEGATVTDIQSKSEVLSSLSNQRVSALLRQMIEAGEVVKSTDKKKSYFALAEQGLRKRGQVVRPVPKKRGDNLRYTTSSRKAVNIPDEEIKKSMKLLDLSEDEAIQMWLEDNEIEVNQEQEELNQKAKAIKIQHGASADKERKPAKERTVKVSDEKKELFHTIYSALLTYGNSNVQVLKENKLFSVQINEKIFKIDLIEQRPPKK